MTSPIDQRRLNDGATALQSSAQLPETIAEVRVQLEVVYDGIAALQSLDDLGPEANAQAHLNQKALWKRMEVLELHLQKLEGKATKP